MESKSLNIILMIVGIVLTAFLIAQTALSISEIRFVGAPEPMAHELFVEGRSVVKTPPDLALINLGFESVADTVAAAQEKNTTQMNEVIRNVKALGIADEDLQTQNYNAYEKREWNPGTSTYDSQGWVVNQTLEVSIRDLDKVSQVLQTAGQANVTSLNGPRFQIEDPNIYRDQAREEALENARANADKLEKQLGVKLGKVIGYDEYIEGGNQPIFFARSMDAMGFAESAPEPVIETGTEEIRFNVNVRYEIK